MTNKQRAALLDSFQPLIRRTVNQVNSDDLMPLMKSGPETEIKATVLLDLIRVASDPTQKPPVYRVARREAGDMARLIYRTAVALAWREQMARSAALPPQPRWSEAEHNKNLTPNRFGGGYYGGD